MNLDEILQRATAIENSDDLIAYERPASVKMIRSLVERVKEAEEILDKAEELIYPEYCGTSIWEEFEKKREAYLEKYNERWNEPL
jgi:hypothetical protein